MRSLLRRTAATAILAASVVAGLPAAAHAAGASCHRVHQASGPNYGILNGTQVNAPIDLGLDISGVALGLLGFANATGGDRTTTVHCGN